jgi:hypothetical protein
VNVRRIQLGYGDVRGALVHRTIDGKEAVLLEETNLESLRITLSTGQEIQIDLFEQRPGAICITGDCLVVRPIAGNRVSIETKEPVYE